MDCLVCHDNDHFDQLPPRERIAADPHWRVAHAFETSADEDAAHREVFGSGPAPCSHTLGGMTVRQFGTR